MVGGYSPHHHPAWDIASDQEIIFQVRPYAADCLGMLHVRLGGIGVSVNHEQFAISQAP